MTVLVTGAGGYLGSRIVRRLAESGDEVAALGRHSLPDLPESVSQVTADLCDMARLPDLLSEVQPRSVIHCAANIPKGVQEEDRERSFRDNVEATKALLAACDALDIPRIVFASTISVYRSPARYDGVGIPESDPPAPQGFYGEHKLQAECLCREWCAARPERRCVVLRYAGIHGGGRRSGVVYAFATAALQGKPITAVAPGSRYSLLFVDDAADAAILALRHSRTGTTVFNIAGGEAASLVEIAEQVVRLSHSPSEIRHGDQPENAPVLSIAAARATLGFTPTPLATWLRDEIAFLSPDTSTSL